MSDAGETAQATWTPERANRALPLVRRIADDLIRQYQQWQTLMGQYELTMATVSSATPSVTPNAEAERLEREVQRVAQDIQGYLAEFASLGIECKSIENGLVDFPGERDGRVVYYCWQVGERAVTHWHEVDGGFAGRQPI